MRQMDCQGGRGGFFAGVKKAIVDRVTVYNDDRLVYSLKDGTEITIEL